MKVDFYKMTSSNNTINKIKKKQITLDCQVYNDCDVVNPFLILNINDVVFSCNYIYIEKFKRFYFINDITISEGNKIVITCHVDVLDTYWSSFKDLPLNIIRNSNVYNLYMKDPLFQCTERTHKQVALCAVPAGGFPFLTTPAPQGHSFVLNSL